MNIEWKKNPTRIFYLFSLYQLLQEFQPVFLRCSLRQFIAAGTGSYLPNQNHIPAKYA